MSANVKYWLWLQRALGEGAAIKPLISEFGSAKNVYDANLIEWRMSPSLTIRQVDNLEQTKITDIEEIIYTCDSNGWQIIDYEDEAYPKRLKEIINPPAVLFVDGTMPDVDSLITIGIVGTRKASEYAVKVTHLMSKGIAEAGALVVSGGALGVDTYAHRGAIVGGGKTLSILGCGFGTNYLNSNKALREQVKLNGALVTEFPPFTPAGKTTFPIRNRIISGISLGVLVVEAGEKSGSLITANCALEQNRDVYAVPASVLSTSYSGSNKLIDDGARVVTKPIHLIESYLPYYPTADGSKIRSIDELAADDIYNQSINSANTSNDVKSEYSAHKSDASVVSSADDFDNIEKGRKSRLKKEKTAMELSGDLKTVYDCLKENFIHIDVIIAETGLSSAKVISALTQLEMLEVINSASGKRYKKS